MESMNISLPEPMKQFIDAQVMKGQYSSASEYMRELVRADEKRKAREALEVMLLEGLASPASQVTATHWDAIRAEGARRHKLSAIKKKH